MGEKELLDKILRFLPNYFLDLGRLISGPKRFVASRELSSDETFESALVFVAISVIIIFFTQANRLKIDNMSIFVAQTFISASLNIAFVALSVIISWGIVGWRGASRQISVITMYYSVTFWMMFMFVSLLVNGLLKQLAPEFYSFFVKAIVGSVQPSDEVYKNTVETITTREIATFFSAGILANVGAAIAFIWLVIGWGAFRKLAGLQKWKSVVAFILSLIFSILAISMVSFATGTMSK